MLRAAISEYGQIQSVADTLLRQNPDHRIFALNRLAICSQDEISADANLSVADDHQAPRRA
jgi:hypothetical protein